MLRPLAELRVFGVAPLLFGLFAVPSAAPAADADGPEGRPPSMCETLREMADRIDQPTISVSENQ